jgi:hypothetical protein
MLASMMLVIPMPAAAQPGIAHILFDGIEPFLAGVEGEILDAAMGRVQDATDLFERLIEATGVGHLEIETVEFVLRALIFLPDHIGALEFVEHRRDRDDDGHVFAFERPPAPTAAATPITRHSRRLDAQLAPAFVFFALIVLEDADDSERTTIEQNGFADGTVIGTIRPEFVDNQPADYANALGAIDIEKTQAASVLDDMFVDRNEIGPAAANLIAKTLIADGQRARAQFGNRRDM